MNERAIRAAAFCEAIAVIQRRISRLEKDSVSQNMSMTGIRGIWRKELEGAVVDIKQQCGATCVIQQPIAYAVRNSQLYWVGIWNEWETAEKIRVKGFHGEVVVPLVGIGSQT